MRRATDFDLNIERYGQFNRFARAVAVAILRIAGKPHPIHLRAKDLATVHSVFGGASDGLTAQSEVHLGPRQASDGCVAERQRVRRNPDSVQVGVRSRNQVRKYQARIGITARAGAPGCVPTGLPRPVSDRQGQFGTAHDLDRMSELDFHLDSFSRAVGLACPRLARDFDRTCRRNRRELADVHERDRNFDADRGAAGRRFQLSVHDPEPAFVGSRRERRVVHGDRKLPGARAGLSPFPRGGRQPRPVGLDPESGSSAACREHPHRLRRGIGTDWRDEREGPGSDPRDADPFDACRQGPANVLARRLRLEADEIDASGKRPTRLAVDDDRFVGAARLRFVVGRNGRHATHGRSVQAHFVAERDIQIDFGRRRGPEFDRQLDRVRRHEYVVAGFPGMDFGPRGSGQRDLLPGTGLQRFAEREGSFQELRAVHDHCGSRSLAGYGPHPAGEMPAGSRLRGNGNLRPVGIEAALGPRRSED